jgi:hypothetical protein
MPYIGKKPADVISTAIDATTGDFSGNVTAGGTLAVTGETTLATHLNMGDSDKIKLGASSDLEVYHDGSNSFVDDTGTGSLYLRGESQVIIGNMTGEQAAVFNDDGAVTLNHDNSAKLATSSSGITITGGVTTTTASSLEGGAVFNEAGASVDFRVEGDTDANALVVDASGDRVGIGVDAPASKLEISAGVNSHGLLRLDDTDAGNLGGYMQFDSNGTNKANIQNANNAGIHLCVGTGGTVTFTNLGYTAANALDDYEEGTWTPAFSSTNASFSYSVQGGTYTKVGRLCMLSFRLALSGSPSGTTTNGVVVSGMPFTSATLEQTYHGGMFGVYFNINLDSTGVLAYQTHSSGATVELKVVGDNLGEQGVQANDLNSNAQIRGQIIYHTS